VDPWTTIHAVTQSDSIPEPSGGADANVLDSPRRWPSEGVYLFDATGRRVASTNADDLVSPPVRDLADLESRFVQPDGMPLGLDRRGRRAAAVAENVRRRVMLVSEPLESNDPDGFNGVVIAILPFADDDPATIQRALASVLAHELRTPLTTIQAGAELLAGTSVSDATKAAAAESLARESERLNRIVEDLVVLVRWGVDPPPEDEPVLVHRVLASAVDRRSRHGLVGVVDLRAADSLPVVVGHSDQLEHAFGNLLDHAIHNSPSGAPVEVEAREDREAVEVRFRDMGPGRDAAAAAVAFDLFVRSARGGRDPSGGNFAMVVARRLVERMRGTIHAEAGAHGETIVRLPVAV
jgi:two-component system, OmpR family, sensor kinase